MNGDPASDSRGLSVTLPRDVSAVEDGRRAVLEFLEPLMLDDEVINHLEVVLEELVSNVVRHADEATHVQLSAYQCDDGICLCVEDDGAAFNPLQREPHEPFGKLEDAKLGGLGIPLIKRLSRSVEYDRIGSANRIKVVIDA